MNITRIRHNQCLDNLTASLPAAYLAISSEQLSLGRLEIDNKKAEYLIEDLLLSNMNKTKLNAQLQQITIEISDVMRPESESHWLSGTRPASMPVVTATAIWRFQDQSECIVNARIEMILD